MKMLRIIAGITVFIPCNKVLQKGSQLRVCILFYKPCYELAKCLLPVCVWMVRELTELWNANVKFTISLAL